MLDTTVKEGYLLTIVRDVDEKLSGQVINYLVYEYQDMALALYTLMCRRLSLEYRRMCSKLNETT